MGAGQYFHALTRVRSSSRRRSPCLRFRNRGPGRIAPCIRRRPTTDQPSEVGTYEPSEVGTYEPSEVGTYAPQVAVSHARSLDG